MRSPAQAGTGARRYNGGFSTPQARSVSDPTLREAAAPPAVLARIHLASPGDVPFIVEGIVAESRGGHFACDARRPDVLAGLWRQVQAIVADGVTPLPDTRDGAAGRAFVLQVGQARAGFAILVEQSPGSWCERIELFALAVHPAWRGRGLGRQLVDSLVEESRSAVVYARCGPRSAAMAALLVSCGFAPAPPRSDGTSVLLWWRTDPVNARDSP